MSTPIYFIETDRQLNEVFRCEARDPVAHAQDWFQSLGLGCVIDNHEGRLACSQLSCGPGGKPGIWIATWPKHSTAPKPLGFHRDKQEWRQVRESLWIGWSTGQAPTCSDLTRDDAIGLTTHFVRLCNGESWPVPEIREPTVSGQLWPAELHRTRLPTLIQRDLQGRLKRPIKPEYSALWQQSAHWFQIWYDIHFHGRRTFDADEALSFVLQILRLKYRLPDALADALGLLDSANYQKIIGAAIGWPAVDDWIEQKLAEQDPSVELKKNESQPAANGDSGPGASAAATVPLEASSGSPASISTSSTCATDRPLSCSDDAEGG